ncbi:MAG: hypothetical protein HXY48_01965 [Ignavibacteriaceae bacterium]|nr:hypothetical protein [Ignavibacteriaceae bacterium]
MKKIKTIILVAFLSALHFFSTLDAYAQIVIEERIEVNPKVKAPNTPNNPTEPTFTYILSWPPDQYRRGKIQTISCYGDTTDTGWTSGGYVTTSLSGSGHHIFKFVNERWYYDSHLGWGWYYDSNNDLERKVLINNQELNTGSLIGASIGTIDIPLLRFNDNICDSGFVKLEVEPTNWADCEEIGWLPIDQLNLRITSGSEFASFYNIRTGTNLGSQTQINPFVEMENLSLFFGFEWEKDGLDDVIIMLNENVPADSVPVYIEVEAEINGVKFAGGDIFYPDKPLIITEINPYEITTGEETLISVEVFNRCEPIDPFTTINLEIISGEEFGSFIDPYTDEKVKTITGLYLFWGYAWIDYVADGISSNETAEVKIRISTSSSGIPPKEVTIYIKPPPIYAYTVPEVLGADDSADVIIKKRNPDGTLEDFPSEQTFELAVLDGCVNGNFMVGDSINVYFEDALQPIKFVTADSLDSEVDSVLIRVGTDIEGYMGPIGNIKGEEEKDGIEREIRPDTLRAGFEKMIAERKAEAEAVEKEGGEPMFPVVSACAPDNPTHPTYYNFGVSVQDECDFENCYWNYEDIGVLLNRQQNNFEFREGQFITVCDLSNPNTTTDDVGQSKPVPYERKRKELNWENSWEVEPCINNDGRVQFSIVTPDRLTIADLYFDFVEAVCTDIIFNPPNNGIIITDLSLSGVTSGKDAMNDFCGHLLYPIRTGTPGRGGYYIEEVIRVHEGIHGDKFYKILNDNKYRLIERLNELVLDCQEYEMFWKIDGVEQHIINALNTYYKFCETEYFENNDEQEIQCHFAIKKLIKDYMDRVNSRFKTPLPLPCYICPN